MFKNPELRSENDYRSLEDAALNRAFDCEKHLSLCPICTGPYKLVRSRKNNEGKTFGSVFAVCRTCDNAPVMNFWGKQKELQTLKIPDLWVKIMTFGPFASEAPRTPADIPKIPTQE